MNVCRERIARKSAGMLDTRILGVRGADFKEIACTAGQIVCSSRTCRVTECDVGFELGVLAALCV